MLLSIIWYNNGEKIFTSKKSYRIGGTGAVRIPFGVTSSFARVPKLKPVSSEEE